MLTIDGSIGEGGGQILRSALALSMLTDKPFRIVKIRAGRKQPGLLRQHLTAVQAAAKVSGAKLEGAGLGSQALTFWPAAIRSGEFHFAIGTAGSTTLVLQTVLPALMLAGGPSRLILEGGTHNPHAPPVDFLMHAYLPLIQRMGPAIAVQLERYGFYPAGGGRITVSVEPAEHLQHLNLTERGEITARQCEATAAGLPDEIGQRELDTIAAGLDWPQEAYRIRRLPAKPGPGNFVTIKIGSQHVCEVFTGFGQRGVRAEIVAAGVLEQVHRYLAAEVPVGPYLADQLLLPFVLAGGGSFLTLRLTPHSLTNIEVIAQFLDQAVSVGQLGQEQWLIRIT